MPIRSSTLKFGSPCTNASELINRLMVKPIPANTATPNNSPQPTWCGIFAKRNWIASQQNNITPMGLPRNNPAAIPNGTGFITESSDKPLSDTPVFMNANSGKITKDTEPCKSCSKFSATVWCSPGAGRNGMKNASNTPARVA